VSGSKEKDCARVFSTSRKVAGELPGKIARITRRKPARRFGPTSRRQPVLMDELFVHKGRILRLKVWRRGLGLASHMCEVPASWCRQQQLLTHQHIFRRKIENSLLSLANRGINLTGRAMVHRLRLEPKKAKKMRKR
jgi:hypothetical protein